RAQLQRIEAGAITRERRPVRIATLSVEKLIPRRRRYLPTVVLVISDSLQLAVKSQVRDPFNPHTRSRRTLVRRHRSPIEPSSRHLETTLPMTSAAGPPLCRAQPGPTTPRPNAHKLNT